MQLSPNLKREIIDFLFSLPNIHSTESQRALLYDAGLDRELQDLIPFGKPTAEFIPILVEILLHYGKTIDERNSIEVLLEATKRYIGIDKKVLCNNLIEQVKVALPDEKQREGTPIISPVLHNLPQPDYSKFIGRENELEQIYALLSPQHRSWVITIDGIGGIGKSALALEIADNYRRQYYELPEQNRFDAIVWTTAKQTILTSEGIISRSQTLCTLKDIYTTIAITLRREDIIQASLTEQANLVRQALTQQRTLLIIDNLETVDDEQTLAFIREVPAPTKVIVTTRHRLDIAYPLRLVAMPEEESIQLIHEAATLKGITLTSDEVSCLYQRTSGVPLAIIWSIAQMGFGYSIGTVLTRLGQPNSDIIKFCFDAAIERIKENPAYKLLLVLSLFATDANREALGTISDLSEWDRDDGLVMLEKLSLINKSDGRFGLLPLTKGFIETLLQKSLDLKASFQRAFINYFKEFCAKFGGGQWRLYPKIDPELKNIQEALEWAYWLGMWREVGSFVSNLVEFLDRRGLWNELIEYAEMGVEAGREINDKRLIMEHTGFGLGWAKAIRFGQLEEGLEAIRKAKEIAQELNDERQYAIASRNEASLLRKLGKNDDAEQILLKTLKLWEKIGDQQWEIRTIAALGCNEGDRGNFQQALEYFATALKKSEEIEETDQIAANMVRMSNVLFRQRHFQEAQSKAKEALRLSEQFNIVSSCVYCHSLLAKIEYALGKIDEAKKHLNIIYDTYTKLGRKDRIQETEDLLEAINTSPNDPSSYLAKYVSIHDL